jgi:NAD-dependent SIR2 family protein deacetylase
LLIPGIGCKHSKRLVVLTGAGASTECGIPDYRREGYVGSGRRVSVHMELTAVGSNP